MLRQSKYEGKANDEQKKLEGGKVFDCVSHESQFALF